MSISEFAVIGDALKKVIGEGVKYSPSSINEFKVIGGSVLKIMTNRGGVKHYPKLCDDFCRITLNLNRIILIKKLQFAAEIIVCPNF